MKEAAEEEYVTQKCSGCGVVLQNENSKAAGYIPTKAWGRTAITCQRCFRIIHYNEALSVTFDQSEFLHLLGKIGAEKALVIHIVDLFDFDGSIISGLQRFVGHNPVLLAVNKIDLLPEVTNWNRMKNWVQRQAKEYGVRVVDVVLVSAKRNLGFDRLLMQVTKWRGDRDVYVVGATNVGKSTLVNRLIQDYSKLDGKLTTSRYPGTTLDIIRIPLDDGKYVIDTPGIIYKNRLTELVSYEDLGSLLPDKPLNPVVYQLNEKQTLFFGAFTRFDFVTGECQSFTCYLSNNLPIHRTKLERADTLYEHHRGGLLAPPPRERLEELPAWTKHQFRVGCDKDTDIFISGLGWIKYNGTSNALIDVHAPKGIKVLVRPSLI